MNDTFSVRVRTRTQEAEAICGLELEDEAGHELPPFTAGAHIDVHLAPGLIRQYSLCGDETDRLRWRIAVLRDANSRGGSAAVHERLLPGVSLQVGFPRNQFALTDAPHSLLLAGGIGVTPLLSMARALHRRGRPFSFHYCARSPERMAFRGELAAAAFAGSVHLHVEDGPPSQAFDVKRVLAQAPRHTHLYVCGPAGFMDHVLQHARAQGWDESRLHCERFAAAPVPAQAGDAPFLVRVASTGLTCEVPPGRTVLEVLLAHGVALPYSCEAGVCGTCLTRVIDGVPDHRDSYLTDDERAANREFTPCCSRALSPLLVLDL